MDDLISRQEAIDALAKAMPSLTTPDGCGQFDHDIQVTDEAYVDCMQIIHELPSAQPEQRWIPCSKKTPTAKHKTYWICTDTGYQCECRWTNVNLFWTDLTTEWHWHIMDIPQYSKVVAWRELPDPWEGDNNG